VKLLDDQGGRAVATENAHDLLRELCADLRLFRHQAGGPSLRALASRVKVSKSQIGAILSGHIRRPPDWGVVRAVLDSIIRHAEENDSTGRISLPTGVEAYWRYRYALVEHAFTRPRQLTPAPRAGVPVAAAQAGLTQPVVPRQLPRAPGHFAGRAAELGTLSALVRKARNAGTAMPVAVIDGTAGTGKTTLALQWAHAVARDFPDAQLHVNLRGFDPGGQEMSPAAALRRFIEALGGPADRIPRSVDTLASLYRSLLADKRALVVLDNAGDAGQVRPLLPGSPRALTIITSRRQLTPLVAVDGAHRLALDVMPPADARRLLAGRLGAERVSAESGATDRIIDACAGLPLALAIAAARAEENGFPLAVLAAELSQTRHRLDILDGGDVTSRLRSAFSWSYDRLTMPAARLFRLLGLHPGPDISTAELASLAGCPVPAVRPLVAELTGANLISERLPGRYVCHDLLRAYGIELTLAHDEEASRRAASARLEWLTVEHEAMRAMMHDAAGHVSDTNPWQLAWALEPFLQRQGYWHGRSVAWQAALSAASRSAELIAEALGRAFPARQVQRAGTVYGSITPGPALAGSATLSRERRSRVPGRRPARGVRAAQAPRCPG
jgi:hypothetical protein